MSNPRGMNGTDVLLIVNGYTIPGQRSNTQSETTQSIDMSSKDSRGMRRAPGRYDSKMTLTALYLPLESGFVSMQNAHRAGQYITVVRTEPQTRVSWPASSASGIETASCIITDMSPQFPDQGAATVNISIEVDGTWTAL